MGINGGSSDPDIQEHCMQKNLKWIFPNNVEIEVPDNMPNLLGGTHLVMLAFRTITVMFQQLAASASCQNRMIGSQNFCVGVVNLKPRES